MKTVLLAAALGALLVGAIYGAVRVWQNMAGSEISSNGMIALVLGAVLTLLVGGGLMALVFYSSRHGHDDDHY